jgi:hypothetical protein
MSRLGQERNMNEKFRKEPRVVVHALTPNIQEVEAAGSRPAWVTW